MTAPLASLEIADASDVLLARVLARRVAAASGLDVVRQAAVAGGVADAAVAAIRRSRRGLVVFRPADDGALVEIEVTGGASAAGSVHWSLPLRERRPLSGAISSAGIDRLELLAEDNEILRALVDAVEALDPDAGGVREQLADLTTELDETNRGLIALHMELEDAREAEARLAAIVRSSDDAMFSMTTDRIIVSWNPGAERLLGYPADEIVGQPVDVLVPVEWGEQLAEVLRQLEAGERARPYDSWRRRKDGSVVEVTVRLSAIRDPQRRLIGYSAVLSDLSERRRAEQALAEARADQEVIAERERIARDLHDLVIQRLFASGMSLQAALNAAPPPTLAARIATVVDDLDATIAEIRSTIFGLGQAPERRATVRRQILDTAARAAGVLGFQPHVRFHGPVDTLIPATIGEQLLAVLREALSNVARHAHASSVDIVVDAGREVVLEVIDDGCGLGEVTRRSGLANMGERAEALGGSFEAVNGEGRGTRLEWRVPMPDLPARRRGDR